MFLDTQVKLEKGKKTNKKTQQSQEQVSAHIKWLK